MQTPIDDSYWVIEGRFLAGEYPGTPFETDTATKLQHFIDIGVTSFIDLTEEGELNPYAHILSSITALIKNPPQHFRYPIRDLGTPTYTELHTILSHINQLLSQGEVIYVHCWGGIGRTGTVIGSYMVSEMDLTGQEALGKISSLRKGTPDGWRQSPETPEQRQMVLRYHNETLQIFVDVDDTLILYKNGDVEINRDLVEVLTNGLDLGIYDLTIWSGTGAHWAKEWSGKLFPGYNLPFGSKDHLWDSIPTSAFAIDDRLQSQREYLKHFNRVFLPMEFVNLIRQGAL